MPKFISITFGSYNILKNIINNNPSQQFELLQSQSDSHKLQLVNLTNNHSIFNSGNEFIILHHSGNYDLRGIVNFMYFSLSIEQAKIFECISYNSIFKSNPPNSCLSAWILNDNKQTDSYVVVTCWKLESDLNNWKKTDQYTSLLNTVVSFGTNPYSTSYSHLKNDI